MDTSSFSNSTLFSKELNLLLSILRINIGEKLHQKFKESLADMNWEEFIELARHHRVYPVLYSKLQNSDETWIPQDVMLALRKDYQRNTFQMLQLSAEMEQVSKQFTESNIRALVLKGPVLAADLYGDISLRTSGDLDILVPIQDLEHAENMLVRLGYVKDDYIQTILNDWKWRHHHITFFHHKKGIKVEIHWRLSPGPGKEPTFNELWERKRISAITTNPVYFLGREDLFLFLVAHGARHGWSRLRWLVDMDRIARQDLDYSKLKLLLIKNRQHHIGAQAMILAAKILYTPLTTELVTLASVKRGKRLAEDALFYIRQKVNLHTYPVPELVSKYHKRHLYSLMAPWQKILFILSFFHPYPEDAETLKLPERLHILYFPLRPFLWIWRKTKKNNVSQGEI